MTSISSVSTPAARALAHQGVAFAPEIARAAATYRLDPRLLAAVAAQETGGPGSNAGRNVVGDGGHGHGIFQIDDRFHAFARSDRAMAPQANANFAARMISGLLKRYGDVRSALCAYNAGSPHARGTVTLWQDGARLGYADSVLRHYSELGGETTPLDGQPKEQLTQSLIAESPLERAGVNSLLLLSGSRPQPHHTAAYGRPQPPVDFSGIVDPDAASSD